MLEIVESSWSVVTLSASLFAAASEGTAAFLGAGTSIFEGRNFLDSAHLVVTVVMIWLGLAVFVGGIAKLLVPGERPIGTCSTMVLGFLGTTCGCLVVPAVLIIFFAQPQFDPLSFPAIVTSIMAAAFFLWIYKLFVAAAKKMDQSK